MSNQFAQSDASLADPGYAEWFVGKLTYPQIVPDCLAFTLRHEMRPWGETASPLVAFSCKARLTAREDGIIVHRSRAAELPASIPGGAASRVAQWVNFDFAHECHHQILTFPTQGRQNISGCLTKQTHDARALDPGCCDQSLRLLAAEVTRRPRARQAPSSMTGASSSHHTDRFLASSS